MHHANKNLFQGAFPGLKIPVFDAQVAQRSQQPCYASLLLLGVEGVDQLVAIIGKVHRLQCECAGDLLQRVLQVQAKLFLAQLAHKPGLVLDQDNLALADNADAVGHLLRFFDVVGGEDDGDAAFPQLAHHFPHVPAQLHVYTGGGLIKEEDAGFVGQRLGDHHATLHAA